MKKYMKFIRFGILGVSLFICMMLASCGNDGSDVSDSSVASDVSESGLPEGLPEIPAYKKKNYEYVLCFSCEGSGLCQTCAGTGVCYLCDGTGELPTGMGMAKCYLCDGSGDCPACNGKTTCRYCEGYGYRLEVIRDKDKNNS